MERIDSVRSDKIQILRGLAILAVVCIHSMPTGGIVSVFVRPFLNFSVGLFLFLSGLLSDAGKWHPKKRILKLAIPYVIWSVIYVVLRDLRHPLWIPADLAKKLLTGQAASMMYYVFVYCELTLLMPLIDRLARSKYRLLGFLISPLEIVLMRMLPMIAGFSVGETIGILMEISCLGWFTYYYLGYLLGNGLLTVPAGAKRLTVWLSLSVLLQIGEGYLWYAGWHSDSFGTQLKLTSLLTGAIFALLSYRFILSEHPMKAPVLQSLGDHSFGIFFSHIAVLMGLKLIPFYDRILFFPLNAIVAAALSLLLVILLRKPLGKYAKYLAF